MNHNLQKRRDALRVMRQPQNIFYQTKKKKCCNNIFNAQHQLVISLASLFYTGEKNTWIYSNLIYLVSILDPSRGHLHNRRRSHRRKYKKRFNSTSALFSFIPILLCPERFIFQAQTSRQTKRRRPVWTWVQSCGAQSRVMRLNQVAECGGLHYLP